MLKAICAAATLLALFVSGASGQSSPNPTDAVGYFIRGTTWNQDDDRAIADYSEAIRLNPKFVQAYHSRGAAFMTKGDLNKAIADFTETIKLSPKFVAAYKHRAECWYAKRDYDRAIADFTEAIRLGEAYLIGDRGYLWHLKGNFDQAIADYTEAIKRRPGNHAEELLRKDAMQKKAPSLVYVEPLQVPGR